VGGLDEVAAGDVVAPTGVEVAPLTDAERVEATTPTMAATKAAAPRPRARLRERSGALRSWTAGELSVSIVAVGAGPKTGSAPLDRGGVDRTPLLNAGTLSRIRVTSSSIASAL
jgi:hypothetical protein